MFMIGDTIAYSCVNPAFINDDDEVKCQADGLWMPPVIESCRQIGKKLAGF